MTIYPDGYGTRRISLDAMRVKHGPKMHPEFARRFFAYIEHKNGLLGVGGGWRGTQPDRPGFAPDGKSFHQDQRFASGVVGYAAVDLVKGSSQAGAIHVAPAWADTGDAPDFGLHTFIRSPIPEPWHIQPVEIRGWQTWVNAGRPDPPTFQLPGTIIPQPPPSPEGGSVFQKMIRETDALAVFALYTGGYKTWVADDKARKLLEQLSGRPVEVLPAKSRTLMFATGPIVGPIPDGYDAWGNLTG